MESSWRAVKQADAGCRCTRNCYDCPICTAPLSINALDQESKRHLTPHDSASSGPSGPFFLSCPYCDWSSLDVGIQLDRHNKIYQQIAEIRRKKHNVSPASPKRERSDHSLTDALASDASTSIDTPQSREDIFMNLTNFYKKELSESAGGNPVNPYMDSNYGSPGNLARIVQMFGGLPMAALKKMREKPQPMREAQSPAEGLSLLSSDADSEIIHKMQDLGWDSAITTEQRTSYSFNYNARFTDELWPVSTLLRTRRQKRCRNCRNILLKPDPKMGSSKHQIRLLALSHIPKLSLRAFTPGSSPIPPLSFTFATTLTKPTSTYDYDHIRPFAPIHFLLTLTNPLFDSVRITLATPATTPGKVQSKVTILCPSFEIGAGGDVWDEALDASKSASRLGTGRDAASGREEDRQPEAGKIWDRGRNWTSVVVEVVPGSLTPASGSLMEAVQQREKGDTGGQGNGGGRGEKRVDEDVLEIPVFVRVEWEAEAVGEGAVKGEKEARELAFWSVLGAGRIVG